MIWVHLAWRNIFANRRRSLLAIGAVAAATIALLLYGNYINAIRAGLEYSTIHGGTGHLQISGKGGFDSYSDQPLQFALTKAQYAALEATIDHMPNARRIVPRLQFSGLVSNGPRTLSFAGAGIDPVAEKAAFGARQKMVAGTPLSGSSPEDGVVLGVELARRLGVKPGDVVTVLTPTVSGALNAMDMRLIGLESTGTPQTDLFYLRAALPTVQSLMATDKISSVAILLDEKADIDAARNVLLAAVPNAEARDWIQLTPIYKQVVQLYEDQFRVFGAFIVLVTLFGLATLILTSVLERTREIGTLRSLGISKLSVRHIFVIEGLLVALIGLVLGTVLGALASGTANALHLVMPPPPGRTTGYPLRLLWDWHAVEVAWIAVIALGTFTAWVTSGRAARLKIVDALATI